MFNRAILSYRFAISCGLIIFFTGFSELDNIIYENGIVETLVSSFGNTFSVITITIAANVFCGVYRKDTDTQFLKYWIPRTGYKKYTYSCCYTTFISAVCCYSISTIAFGVICLILGNPVINVTPREAYEVFDILLLQGHPILFIVIKIIIRGIWIGLISVLSLVLSAYITYASITFAYPIIWYYILYYPSMYFSLSKNVNFYFLVTASADLGSISVTLLYNLLLPLAITYFLSQVLEDRLRKGELL